MVKLSSVVLTGHKFFGVGISVEFQMFTPTNLQKSYSIGQIEVSDGQVHPLERRH